MALIEKGYLPIVVVAGAEEGDLQRVAVRLRVRGSGV
jgi:hypothetical protein